MKGFERALHNALNDNSEPKKLSVCFYKDAEYKFGERSERKNTACKFFLKNECTKHDCPYSHSTNLKKTKFKTELC